MRTSWRDVELFVRELSAGLSVGLAPVDVLPKIRKGMKNGRFAQALEVTEEFLRLGLSLSEALTKARCPLPRPIISLISAGETSGELEVWFRRIVEYVEARRRIQSAYLRTITYPVVVLVIGAILMIVCESYLASLANEPYALLEFAAISRGFESHSTEFLLPVRLLRWAILCTLVLLALSTFAVSALILAAPRRARFERFLTTLPFFGVVVARATLYHFATLMGTFVSGGAACLRDGLEAIAQMREEPILAGVCKKLRDALARGASPTEALGKEEWFPSHECWLMEQAFLQDTVTEYFQNLAQRTLDELEEFGRSLRAIEPMMMAFIGLLMGIYVLTVWPLLMLWIFGTR